MDVRYVDDAGVATQPPSALNQPNSAGGYFVLWHQANNSANSATVRHAARMRLRNWVHINRRWIDWLRVDMAATTTPLVKVFMGEDQPPADQIPAYPGMVAAPVIEQFMRNGVLPGPDTVNDASDDNLGVWVGIGDMLAASTGHSDHIHLDFQFPAAGVQAPADGQANAHSAAKMTRHKQRRLQAMQRAELKSVGS